MLEVIGICKILKYVGEICEKFYRVCCCYGFFFGENVGEICETRSWKILAREVLETFWSLFRESLETF